MTYFFSILSTLGLVIGSLGHNSLAKAPDLSWMQWDKLAHFLAYGALTFIFSYEGHLQFKANLKRSVLGKCKYFMENLALLTLNGRCLVWAITMAIAIGTVIEVSQLLFTEHRIFEMPDLIANIIGAIVGGMLFIVLVNRKNYSGC